MENDMTSPFLHSADEASIDRKHKIMALEQRIIELEAENKRLVLFAAESDEYAKDRENHTKTVCAGVEIFIAELDVLKAWRQNVLEKFQRLTRYEVKSELIDPDPPMAAMNSDLTGYEFYTVQDVNDLISVVEK